MKIGILTWFKSLNHGAVLQAYASQQFLKKHKYNSLMLDYDRNYHVMESNIDKIKRRINNININYLLMKTKIKKWNNYKKFKFEKFINENIILGKKYDLYTDLDVVMIGSDMVFDFYEGYNPFMYGKDVRAKKIFSYAACFGYTTEELFSKFDKNREIIEFIKKMNSVGYRDNNTGLILKNCCNLKKIEKNIDPVLLYGFQEEKKIWNNHSWNKKKYILIYSYQSNLNKRSEVNAIRKFALEEKLEIISVGYYHAWCDENINADPKEFVELFSNASYVVTDTFHGLVFSIIFNKKFALIVRNNSFKVLDLLQDLKIKYDKNVNLYERLCSVKNGSIDYNIINKTLNKLRAASSEYLLSQVGEVDDNK